MEIEHFLCGGVFIFLISLVVGVTMHNMHYADVALEMVSKGVPAEMVPCAMGATIQSYPQCLAKVAKQP